MRPPRPSCAGDPDSLTLNPRESDTVQKHSTGPKSTDISPLSSWKLPTLSHPLDAKRAGPAFPPNTLLRPGGRLVQMEIPCTESPLLERYPVFPRDVANKNLYMGLEYVGPSPPAGIYAGYGSLPHSQPPKTEKMPRPTKPRVDCTLAVAVTPKHHDAETDTAHPTPITPVSPLDKSLLLPQNDIVESPKGYTERVSTIAPKPVAKPFVSAASPPSPPFTPPRSACELPTVPLLFHNPSPLTRRSSTSALSTRSTTPSKKRKIVPPAPSCLGLSYSDRFPPKHVLLSNFMELYTPLGEIGSGGFGFVLTAREAQSGTEVAVKFIIKELIPSHGWANDPVLGVVPVEASVLRGVRHPGIIKFLHLFEDNVYFYLVQELHGSPWFKPSAKTTLKTVATPTKSSLQKRDQPSPAYPLSQSPASAPSPVPTTPVRPEMGRRPSHDLFECIEQFKRLPEAKAKYVFAQVVDIVWYLHSLGIVHRDIKDENLVVDKDFKVKLIDFGSATYNNPHEPAPFYDRFYGTASFASAEIIQGIPYQAAPAEIWTLGTLLSFLVTGETPFPPASSPESKSAYIKGEIDMRKFSRVSPQCVDLLKGCLRPDPKLRFSIHNVRQHEWLQGVFDRA